MLSKSVPYLTMVLGLTALPGLSMAAGQGDEKLESPAVTTLSPVIVEPTDHTVQSVSSESEPVQPVSSLPHPASPVVVEPTDHTVQPVSSQSEPVQPVSSPPSQVVDQKPQEIEYHVLYTFGGQGTIGPVKIYNNLPNTRENWVVLGLGMSDGVQKKNPQFIAGKIPIFFQG